MALGKLAFVCLEQFLGNGHFDILLIFLSAVILCRTQTKNHTNND